MTEKEQSINNWSFRHIAASIVMIVALMLMWFGFAQFFSFDMHVVSYLFFTQVVFYLAVIFSVYYFVFLQKTNSFRSFWGVQSTKKNIYLGILGFALMVAVTTFIDVFSEKLVGVKSIDVYKGFDLGKLKYLSFIGIIFAPFAEEIFFRGFLQPVFVGRFGKVLGIALVALIFSVLHVAYMPNISAVLGIICVGLILSCLKEYSGSLTPSFVAHLLNNILAVWVIFYM